MKIAVTATGSESTSQVSPRFGRCPYFLIFDTDNGEHEAVPNPNQAAGGGAGIQAAQTMVDRDVTAVLTGNCGPNAFRVFEAAGIPLFTGVGGTAREAVDAYRAGTLRPSGQASVPSHFGTAQDRDGSA